MIMSRRIRSPRLSTEQSSSNTYLSSSHPYLPFALPIRPFIALITTNILGYQQAEGDPFNNSPKCHEDCKSSRCGTALLGSVQAPIRALKDCHYIRLKVWSASSLEYTTKGTRGMITHSY